MHSKRRTTSSRQPPKADGQIRIIGGQWRGRKLKVVDAQGLRPTTDRVKETLFNWLQFELADAQVLDLFAGSGGLGFEALSRGAAQVQFAETWAPAVRQLHSNIQHLHANATVNEQGALAAIQSQPKHSIDLVFLDPPFGQDWLNKVVAALTQADVVKPNGWIYLEAGPQDQVAQWPADWQLHREKQAGQVTFRLFRRISG